MFAVAEHGRRSGGGYFWEAHFRVSHILLTHDRNGERE